ncbi:MAG: hypothetical protein FWD98_09250 [Defluviitaleaceae bacterium]|nr:hypothetical protein [Defluviitaleaceae bacterium]
MKNIVLMGLSGAGKTSLGAELATRLGLDFADVDTAVCRQEGMSVAEIFKLCGEEGFRWRESAAAAEAAKQRGAVISTGAGIVLDKENVRILRETGVIVFLDKDPVSILAEISAEDIAQRPLLAQGAVRLCDLAEQRAPLYREAADLHVKLGDSGDKAQHLHAVLEALAARYNLLGAEYAVIGMPVAQSLSPRHFNNVLRGMGRAANYALAGVGAEQLAGWVEYARRNKRGFSVAAPHKQAILPHLDELTRHARLCGAVNAVTAEQGRLTGHNTEIWGIAAAFEQAGVSLRGRNVVIAGAGCAARAAAVFACASEARRVTIAAREDSSAADLIRAVWEHFPGTCMETLDISLLARDPARFADERADIFVNATPLGTRGGGGFPSFGFLNHVGTCVLDMVYDPPMTQLMQEAAVRGLIAPGGLPVLSFGAAGAAEIFFGSGAAGSERG